MVVIRQDGKGLSRWARSHRRHSGAKRRTSEAVAPGTRGGWCLLGRAGLCLSSTKSFQIRGDRLAPKLTSP